jgi:S1-C subfamily serine protease
VVAVSITLQGRRLNPFQMPQHQGGGGSGFVIDRNRIITNFHVVGRALQENSVKLAEGARITVSFADTPDKEHPAQVIGAMLDYDLALLELKNPEDFPENITPVSLGDSAKLHVGQKIVSIGNPFGLQSTVTTGIVSAIEREGLSIFGIEIPFIQTDAVINPGNSGGPLLDSSGKVIGINNAILSPSGMFIGVGFAVPSNLLQESLSQLEAGGLSGLIAKVVEPDRPRMGIVSQLSVEDYPQALRKSLNLPDQGVVVTAVAENSPAEKAGLQGPQFAVTIGNQVFLAGVDVITQVDGKPVSNIQDIQRIVLDKEVGDKVTLTVWREGEIRKVTVELEVLSPGQAG